MYGQTNIVPRFQAVSLTRNHTENRVFNAPMNGTKTPKRMKKEKHVVHCQWNWVLGNLVTYSW